MPSREVVIELKKNWVNDPVWDIEETEGFQEHKKELLLFRLTMEKIWADKKAEEDRLRKLGERMGTDNLGLICYLEQLEKRIAKLEKKNGFGSAWGNIPIFSTGF